MTTTLKQLQAICAAATPGEWTATEYPWWVNPEIKLGRVDVWDQDGDASAEDARFIATFNPVLVAKLLAVAEATTDLKRHRDNEQDEPGDYSRVWGALAALDLAP